MPTGSPYPPDWDELPLEEITETTELYTQRKSSISLPANFRILMGTVRDWLKSQLSKLYFRADGPTGADEYEFILGGAFHWLGRKGMRTQLDANRIYIEPDVGDTPVDGAAWVWDETVGKMVLKLGGGDMHMRITVGTAATVWTLSHGFGWVPVYEVRDASGNLLKGLQETIDLNTERVTFSVARSGYVDFT